MVLSSLFNMPTITRPKRIGSATKTPRRKEKERDMLQKKLLYNLCDLVTWWRNREFLWGWIA